MSVANESEPLPSFLSHLRVTAIEVEPPRSVFCGGAAWKTTAVPARGSVICSIAMLRWRMRSVADARRKPSDEADYGEMAQIMWQMSDRSRPPPCHWN